VAKRLGSKVDDIGNLHSTSRDFKHNATILSLAIEQADDYLRELPGKIEVVVDLDETCKLALTKFKGDWHLWVLHHGNGSIEFQLARQATVEQKVEIAKLLPILYQKLLEGLSNRKTSLSEGIDELRKLPFLDFEELAARAKEVEAYQNVKAPF
jgi:hypothetical protein